MHRIDPNPSHAVRLRDALSFDPRVWRNSVETGVVPELTLPFPDPRALRIEPLSVPRKVDAPVLAEKAASDDSSYPRWKYILDVTCILISLPIWLPLLAAVALWVKIASPGPIFFRQERIGRRGNPFMIFKFRTMKVNVETKSHERHLDQLIQADCPMTKLDASGDPRIIFGGRILRATGLDELPQIFNVLRREMSLVGPRPCTQHEFQRYKPWQQERVNAAPGLTGYWQVNGKNKTTFTEMIQMDIFYSRNLSLCLDIVILLKTVPAVMTQFFESRLTSRAGKGSGKPPTGTGEPVTRSNEADGSPRPLSL
jgi:exopolysaccharide production protein ExoY